jgi:D-alanyl-D-alanine carboxypeptidase/D-alanyl-D-alanine-endopeptidase (penicillin-binding protein 4)
MAEQSLKPPPSYCLTAIVGLTAIVALLAGPIASSAELPGLAVAAREILGADQGVYVEAADGTVLLSQAASKPVHPASVSKVPTTLALLSKLGPEHRFTTTFIARGRLLNGTLYGDLVVASDGDPSLVDEDALLVAERLKESGVERIAGDLRVPQPLFFDWKSDDGTLLRHALSGLTSPAALEAVRALEVSTESAATGSAMTSAAAATAVSARSPPKPGIRFETAVAHDGVIPVAGSPGEPAVIVHRSQPLLPLIKALNDYSNNIFVPFADAAGGAAAVQALARAAVPEEMRSEIVLGDGAGTDPMNRLSPRAAVKLLRALEHELATTGHALFDILPVAGVDEGTLRDRLNGPGEAGHVVGKTGTFGDYGASALIGAINTTNLGTVYFAILNHDVPVPTARRRQDRFVRAVLAQLPTIPWKYERDPRPAITRAQVSVVSR